MCKRLVLCCFAVLLMINMLQPFALYADAAPIASGECGENLTWELDDKGLLTISGTGEMYDFDYTGGYWEDVFGGLISKVVISEGVTSIGKSAFHNCDTLVDAIIPDSVTSIGESAFYSCESLKNVQMPKEISYIGRFAFHDCGQLTNIIIPSGITEIPQVSFTYCRGLNNVTIPDGVQVIEYGAFQACTALTSVTIPKSVKTIGETAFGLCSNIKDVYYSGTEEQWNSISMGESNEELVQATIHYNSTMNNNDGFSGEMSNRDDRYGLYATVVENRMSDCNYSSLHEVYKEECRGLLYDINNNGQEELILQYRKDHSWKYEVWTVKDGDVVSLLDTTVFSTSGVAEVSLAIYKDDEYVVFESSSAGSGGDSHEWLFFLISDNSYQETYSLGVSRFWDDGVAEVEYFVNERSVSEKEFDEFYGCLEQETVIPIQEDGMILPELVKYLLNQSGAGGKTENSNSEIKPDINPGSVMFSISTDHTTLSIRKNNKILLGAGLFSNGVQTGDVSGITFQIEDSSVVEVSASFFKDNYLYASLIGLKEGTTNVLFSDSNSGTVATIPVTVYSDGYLCYTLSSVPTKKIEKYPTNFYNVNGLYVDSYTYTVNSDKSATMSFDVYNSNYTYGAVEVYDVNGNLKNAVLIEKMSSSMTSMKEVLWNDVVYLIRDIYDGDLLSYRQESGFSKKTSITVTIPENGYIKICNDPESSFIVGLVNSADLLMSLSSFMGEISGYDLNSLEFSKKLTSKLVTEKVFAECVKDGSKLPKQLWANIGKGIISSPEALVSFSETAVKNIADLELEDVIISTAADFGINIGEETFTYFSGPFGVALKSIFAVGKMENILVQHAHMTQSAGIGSIYIQNQGGGVLGSQQITVESESGFETDTALRVFSVSIDSDLLSKIEEANPALFEAIAKNSSYTYDISLIKNGDETQPSGKITVCIPIPAEWRVPMPNDLKESIYAGMFKIYRLEEDGSTTEMPIDVKDGCFVFETNHFSLYSLVRYDIEIIDNNADAGGNPFSNLAIPIIVVAVIGCVVLAAFCRVRAKTKKKA